MIGHVKTGGSYYHCLSYCLEDKKNLSEEQKVQLSQKSGFAAQKPGGGPGIQQLLRRQKGVDRPV